MLRIEIDDLSNHNRMNGTTMNKPLFEYFEKDHKRIEGFLNRATAIPGKIDTEAYAQFRAGLLRHIGLEEKILFPAAQKAKGGEPFKSIAKLRLDHSALTALMVPLPSTAIIAALRAILMQHDELEESPGGPYEACEALVKNDVDVLLKKVQDSPDVPVLPHRSEPFVLEATRRALARAGYDFAEFERKTA
jgi:hypothetical protein